MIHKINVVKIILILNIQMVFNCHWVNAQHIDSLRLYNKTIKKFAYNYYPKSFKGEDSIYIPKVPRLSPSEVKAISYLSIHKDERLKSYILLIFLRLDKEYRKSFYQTYSLEEDGDVLISKLLQIVGYCQNIGKDEICDFIPSSLAFKYVSANNLLLKDRRIKKTYKAIQKIDKRL